MMDDIPDDILMALIQRGLIHLYLTIKYKIAKQEIPGTLQIDDTVVAV